MLSPLSAIALLAMPLAAFSGGTSPSHLPRGRQVPISLSAGFTSEDPAGGPAPSLNQIRIELSRRVELRTAGLFACRERLLFKTARAAAEECRGSLVGEGTVLTDIPVPTGRFAEPPGTPPHTVRVEGALRAYYGLAAGEPMILARVETGEPMPLVYVIAFAIEPLPSGRTRLAAHKMRIRHGICARGHPNCFADPYGVNDLYSRVAAFEMALHRVSGRGPARAGFLNASCPPRSVDPDAGFTLERIQLAYAEGEGEATGSVDGSCR